MRTGPGEAACWSAASSAPGAAMPWARQPSCLLRPRSQSPEERSFLAFLREAILTLHRSRTNSWLFLLFYQQVTLSWIKMGLGMKNSHFCSAASNYSEPLRSSCCRMEKLQCYFHFSFPLLVTYTVSEAVSLCTASWICKTKSVQHTQSNETVWGK